MVTECGGLYGLSAISVWNEFPTFQGQLFLYALNSFVIRHHSP